MKLLSSILRIGHIDLQPTNAGHIDIESAKTVLYPGAHVAAGNLYEHFHHGIVVDITATDISIVHFWGVKKRNARIQTTTLPIFVAGGIKKLGINTRHLYLINYEDDTLEKQEESRQRAKDMLNKPDGYKYNLLRLNCESFACFCRTDRWDSEQVEILRNFLVNKIKQIYEKITVKEYAEVIAFFKPITPMGALSSIESFNLKQLYQEYA
jgi:hypothetical protein